MTRHTTQCNRRIAIRTLAGLSIGAVAGCLNDGTGTGRGGQNSFKRVAVDGTTLVVELTANADVDQINLIQPNDELFGKREVAAGASQVSYEIGTSYKPGEYRVLALSNGETVAETTTNLRPEVQIRDVGLYRNNPEKPWDEVYGESTTDRKKNGEAFVTVENTGSGPDAIVELRFSGDVPSPIKDPRGSGIYGTERVVVTPGETIDVFSNSYPFGVNLNEDGMGCSFEGQTGQFKVIIETKIGDDQVSKIFNVEYSGSNDMTDCKVTISEG